MTVSPGPSGGYRWVGVAGLLVAVSVLASFVVAFGAPEAIRGDDAITEWYRNSTNQYRFLVASMIAGLGVIALLVFVIGFRRFLAERGAPALLVEVAYAASLVFVAVFTVAGGIGSSIAATLIFSDTFELDPDTARVVLMIGNIWLPAFAGIPVALYLGATSLACRRADVLPRWLVWLGFIITPLTLLAYPGFGINVYLFATWILLVSILLLRARPAGGGPFPAAP
jgi:hypothetical protein